MLTLVIDSGSTKSDWVFFDQSSSKRYSGIGINPISNQNSSLIEHPSNSIDSNNVSKVYYYGAGVIGDQAKQNVKNQLASIYQNAKEIAIHSDILGAARATSAGQISIVSILGTGSNSCLFDGQEIKSTVPSLGYIFGDEGSGFSIGQEVIKSFFYGYMPESDRENFIQQYGKERAPILSGIYKSSKPNYEVAQYASFLMTTEPEYKNYILERVFTVFLDQKVKPLKKSSDFPLNFVGSIAFHYQDILKAVCKVNGFEIHKIIKQPIENLKDYHLENG